MTHEQIKNLFYDKDGVLYWRPRSRRFRYAHMPVGQLDGNGMVATVNGRKCSLNKLVYAYFNDCDYPAGKVHHKDRDPLNCHPDNLVLTSRGAGIAHQVERQNQHGLRGVNNSNGSYWARSRRPKRRTRPMCVRPKKNMARYPRLSKPTREMTNENRYPPGTGSN